MVHKLIKNYDFFIRTVNPQVYVALVRHAVVIAFDSICKEDVITHVLSDVTKALKKSSMTPYIADVVAILSESMPKDVRFNCNLFQSIVDILVQNWHEQ